MPTRLGLATGNHQTKSYGYRERVLHRRRLRCALAAAVLLPALAASAPAQVLPRAQPPGGQADAQGHAALRSPEPSPGSAGTEAPATSPVTVAAVPPLADPVRVGPPVTGTAGDPVAPGNPLAGDVLFGPNAGAAEAAARLRGSRPDDAALLARMADVPTATWLGSWHVDVTSAVRGRVAEAQAAGAVPVFVLYNVPDLDCSGRSASGGARSAAAYEAWVRAVAAGIGRAEAVVIVEPDTLALLCGDGAERYRMLRSAVAVLESNPGTHTYLDAGHSDWVDVPTMAQRLRTAGVAEADGFALNVSNFGTTADNLAYGSALSAALDGPHFVIDTSRNGNGNGTGRVPTGATPPGALWGSPRRRRRVCPSWTLSSG